MAVRVLFVEDVATDAELAIRLMRREGVDCSYTRVETETQFTAALREHHHDIILSDFSLPGFDGMVALSIASREQPDIPFIFVSGTIGEERAIEALRCGAVDYVLKGNLKRLASAVTRAVREAEQRIERRAQTRRIARLTRTLEMLSGINTAVARIRERRELLEETCRIAVTVGKYESASVACLDVGTRTARLFASAGAAGDARNSLIPLDSAALDADTVAATALRLGTLTQVGRTVALPFKVDGSIVGALSLTAPDAGAFSPEELGLLGEVAGNLSFALQYLEKETAVQFLSNFDPLTGLAKRVLFCERLAARLAAQRAQEGPPAVAVIDLEHLATINDSYGRQAGDQLLQSVAERLKSQFDTEGLAYLGAGCFAMILHNTASQESALGELQRRMFAVFSDPFRIAGQALPATVRSGLACGDSGGLDAQSLLQNAEAGCRQAKLAGEHYRHHRTDLSSKLAARLSLEHRLRGALESERYVLHYQPKIDIGTGRITGVEALLRWNDPERGMVSPGEFLPILESTGMIVSVGEWALRHAAQDCRRWKAAGCAPLHIAVNCSPVQLRRRGFTEHVLQTVEGWMGEGWGLDVEITESMLIDPGSEEVLKLRRLRGAGVRVAIDDFGTGYSSLSRLSELPVDTLKIDRSFIDGLLGDSAAARLVPTVISLARAFNLVTVAEGVETRAQFNFLQRAGCSQSQGFLHAKPMSADLLEALLLQTTVASG